MTTRIFIPNAYRDRKHYNKTHYECLARFWGTLLLKYFFGGQRFTLHTDLDALNGSSTSPAGPDESEGGDSIDLDSISK